MLGNNGDGGGYVKYEFPYRGGTQGFCERVIVCSAASGGFSNEPNKVTSAIPLLHSCPGSYSKLLFMIGMYLIIVLFD